MPPSLAELVARKKVLVCVGAGGVGKTTLAAAIGVAAARQGRRTLVLTVDPARRLANALGLQSFQELVQRISIEAFAAQGCTVACPLDAAMLDVKRTFDRVVARYAPSAETRDAILAHPFYQQASTRLAGSQEYMAMERLYECATSGDYDLVVLDTPPSEHALDFLDAPNRLVDLFDSKAFRLLLKPATRLKGGMFRPGSVVMRGLSKFTSAEMFASLLEFFGHLSETFDGFVQQARNVQALLHGDDTAFVLVAACDAVSTGQALFLRDHLQADRLQVGALIANRVAPFPPSPAQAGPELEQALQAWLATVGADANGGSDPRMVAKTSRLVALVARQLGGLTLADAAHLRGLQARVGTTVPLLAVARTDEEPDTLAGLHRLALVLEAGGDVAVAA